jgi:hypothetical protein
MELSAAEMESVLPKSPVSEDSVVVQYLKLLGRLPSDVERQAAETDVCKLVARLLDEPEYRNRFRDVISDNTNARIAARLWPQEKRDYDLHIVFVSREGWSKMQSAFRELVPQLGPRHWLSVLCGAEDKEAFPHFAGTELQVFPGESVFELRARLPTILKEAEWVAVLEDHATPMPGWLVGIMRAIQRTTLETLIFSGTAANETSTSPWSWANFLFNFWQHWHPSAADQLNGTVATTVFRRDLVGSRPLRIYQFENFILGQRGPVVNDFPVNHFQATTCWQATCHVFDNGRVAGSAIRRNSLSPSSTLKSMVRWVSGGRNREIAMVLREHPRFRELPPATLMRVRWIAWCHSAGAIFGALFGGGRAHKRLE